MSHPVEVHPEALRNFSDRATELLNQLRLSPPQPPDPPLRGSIAHVRSETTIVVEQAPGSTRRHVSTGRATEMDIVAAGSRWSLAGDPASARLVSLVDAIAMNREIRDICGHTYAEKRLGDWLRAAKSNAEVRPFGEFLLESLREDVASRSVLVPIEGIALDSPFPVGRLECGYFTEAYFSQVLAAIKEPREGDAPAVRAFWEKKLQGYLGQPFLKGHYTAERDHAAQRAIGEADEALTFLRFFHPAALEARAKCPIGRRGRLLGTRSDAFVERDGMLESLTSEVEFGRAALGWNLSGPEIDYVMKGVVSHVVS